MKQLLNINSEIAVITTNITMKKLIDCVETALKGAEIPYTASETEAVIECEVSKRPVSVRIVCNDENGVLAFLARFPNSVPKGQYEQIFPLINEGNNRGGFSRIVMDPETGIIRSTIFALAKANTCDPDNIIVYLYMLMHEASECYDKIMNVIQP